MATSRRHGERSRSGRSGEGPAAPRGLDRARLRAAARLGYGGSVVDASGVYLRGPDREQYLDAAGGADLPLGHGYPAVLAAVEEALAWQGAGSLLLADQTRLAVGDRLARLAPAGLAPLGLFSGGRVAFDAALALARLVTGREAVVVEPLPSATFAPPAAGLLERRAAEAREAGALVVSDERGLGAGRLGALVGAQAVQLAADLVVVGGLGGGVAPAACLLGTPRVAEAIDGATQAALEAAGLLAAGEAVPGPVACAAALATVEALADGRLARAAAESGAAFGAAAAGLENETEAVVEVRGMGLAWAVECAAPRLAEALVRSLALDRILVVPPPVEGRTVRLLPPLVIAGRELDFVASSLAHACEEL